jgi:hypothetical protein
MGQVIWGSEMIADDDDSGWKHGGRHDEGGR